ncbi:CoA transferase [Bordetella petrii]|nr:CoA transferase [Bordetella petrii]
MSPLEGIRVVDLSNVVMGPYATQLLAEYGADVIKIEQPGGDDARRTGQWVESDMASLFMGVNRGKRSVVLDLKSPGAARPLQALVKSADILVHNIRPQKLEALGIDARAMHEANPRLVYASLTGFGQAGPYGGRPAYDDVIQGMSGLAALSHRHNGEAPRYLPTVTADKTVGLFAVGAILAALVKRERHGVGSTVEIPMFESMVAFTLVEHMYGATFAESGGSMGYPRALAAWRKPFDTQDGFICVMPYTDKHWRSLLQAAGHAGLADDARFTSIAARSEHTDFVYRTLAEILSSRSTQDWLRLLESLQIPCAAINQPEDLLSDPHLSAVGFFQHAEDAGMGRLRFPGVPVLFDGQRPILGLPPRLGQHTAQVFQELELPASAAADPPA